MATVGRGSWGRVPFPPALCLFCSVQNTEVTPLSGGGAGCTQRGICLLS